MSLRGETLPSIESIVEMTRLENERKYVSIVHPEGPETVTLGDGTTVTVRPICPDDASRLQALFTRLSPESIFFRFLGHRKELPYLEAKALANVDYRTRMALVATREQCGEENVIGVARYEIIGPGEHSVAEASIKVSVFAPAERQPSPLSVR